jgi:putative hydrolase of the HAD superfamily
VSWLKAIMFDLGHTLVEENTPIDHPPELMPGVLDAIAGVTLPMGIWSNTNDSTGAHIREWLSTISFDEHFRWIVTSYEVGHRKPAREFFDRALLECSLNAAQVLFVGNQLNTDIVGAQSVGITSVYLTDPIHRSTDDTPSPAAEPTFTIATLAELPDLVWRLRNQKQA